MPDTWIESGVIRKATKFEQVLIWIKKHRESFIGGMVLLAAAGIITAFVVFRHSQLKDVAWKELFIARQQARMGKLDLANKSLKKIENGFSNTTAAGYAHMVKGDILFAQTKYKDAIDAYQKAADFAKVKNIIPVALSNIGKTKEAAKDFEGAKTSYKNFIAKYPEHFSTPEIHYSLAQIYELQNKKTEAKLTYEKIAVLYPQTGWSENAKKKLGVKKKKG